MSKNILTKKQPKPETTHEKPMTNMDRRKKQSKPNEEKIDVPEQK
jgi:hypothetical protein